MSLELILCIAGFLLLLSVFANKVSDKFGIPSLLLFLGMGMLAGSDGIGGIKFHDPKLANYIATIALSFILFSGGLSTKWQHIRPIIVRGGVLATLGVLLTSAFLFLISYYVLNFTYYTSLLLSVIVSSTDAPAVFSIFRFSNVKVSEKIRSLLEFESGSNDPMAVFLSLGALDLLTSPYTSAHKIISIFLVQMIIGTLVGLLIGYVASFFMKKICFRSQGIYSVFGLSIVLLTFSLTQLFYGNGFLSVYICGLVLGNQAYIFRRQFIRFNDSLAWIMQISMFLVLGLLVNPSELGSILPTSLMATLSLIFVARPLAVFCCLAKSKFSTKEKIFISWAGFKGAVPIILATYPLIDGFPHSHTLFNLIFFLVIISVLLQGKTIVWLAKKLKLDED